MEKGRAHYEEPFLIEHLLRLPSEQTKDTSEVSGLPEGGDVSELSARAAVGEAPGSMNRMSQQVVERLDALFAPSDASQMAHRLHTPGRVSVV